jgi:hypothetical protein
VVGVAALLKQELDDINVTLSSRVEHGDLVEGIRLGGRDALRDEVLNQTQRVVFVLHDAR